MNTLKNKEKLIRDLVNSYDSRDDLHIAYKEKMKEILTHCIYEWMFFINENNDTKLDVEKWINDFVEERFKPSDN